jgi:ubiquinone/menaquinone biosynthesis C-methylase UbiE
MHPSEQKSIEEFTKWAKNYDNPITSFPFKRVNADIVRLLNSKENSSLLDVGSGSGILIEKLISLNKNMKLFGLDITPGMVKLAKNKFKNNKNVEITLGSAGKIPYNDQTFDYVTCVYSFHHHPNQSLSIKEMARVLKPGGKLLVLDANIEGPIRKWFSDLETKMNKEEGVHKVTKKEMFDLFSKSGLKDIKQFDSHFVGFITQGTKY